MQIYLVDEWHLITGFFFYFIIHQVRLRIDFMKPYIQSIWSIFLVIHIYDLILSMVNVPVFSTYLS